MEVIYINWLFSTDESAAVGNTWAAALQGQFGT